MDVDNIVNTVVGGRIEDGKGRYGEMERMERWKDGRLGNKPQSPQRKKRQRTRSFFVPLCENLCVHSG